MPSVINKFPNFKIYLIDNGIEKDKFKQMIIKLKLQKHIQFYPWIDYKDMPRFINKFDVGIDPTFKDAPGGGIGMGNLDALSSGLAVLLPDTPGMREHAVNNITALFYSNNTKSLSAAILKILLNNKLRTRLKKNGRKFVINKYNLNKNLASIEHLYQAII